MNNREVLTKILESAQASLEALKPAVGQRHFAACMITEVKHDAYGEGSLSMYFIILKAESNLQILIAETQKLLPQET